MTNDGKSPLAGNPAQGKARRAAILSGLILPGLGQIYLGRRIKGGAIIVSVVAFLGYFLYSIITGFVRYFNIALDLDRLTQTPDQTPGGMVGGAFLKGVVFGALPALIIWGWSAIDAYRDGKRADL